MSERYPSPGPEEGGDESNGETSGADAFDEAPGAAEMPESLVLELEALETRLLDVTELVRELRAENAALRAQSVDLGRERDALWRERGIVSTRLAQIIAKVDALRGET
jgi:hypothetical protein